MKSNSNLGEQKMEDAVNLTREDAEGGKSNDPGHESVARPFKLFGRPMGTLLPAPLICLFLPTGNGTSVAQMSHATVPSPQSDPHKAFELLKTLAGS